MQCLGHTGACGASAPLLSSVMGVVRPCALTILTRRPLTTRRPLSSACQARFMCSVLAFYTWRRLQLIYLKLLLVGECVRDGLYHYKTKTSSLIISPIISSELIVRSISLIFRITSLPPQEAFFYTICRAKNDSRSGKSGYGLLLGCRSSQGRGSDKQLFLTMFEI